MEFYLHFSLLMARSLGFGSIAYNYCRPVKTRSRYGSVPQELNLAAYDNSPDHSTKGTISHVDVLYVLVGTRFQVLFHSPPGVLFTFPSQFCFAIGHQVVFRLGGWAPHRPTGLLVSRGTLDTASWIRISLTWLSHSLVCLPIHFCYPIQCVTLSEPQRNCFLWFSLFPFRSPLLWKSRLISFPRPT